MATTSSKHMTISEYLAHEQPTDRHCELIDGKLVEMPPESRVNARIALFLLQQFLQFVPFRLLCCKDTEMEVTGRYAKTRLPDLMVLTEALDLALGDARGTITQDMPPPRLIVEVVSPGKDNEDRDYRYKRAEYATRGVEEYWIVDPTRQQIVVLVWVDGLYEATIFQRKQMLVSPTFPMLQLTPTQIFSAGRP